MSKMTLWGFNGSTYVRTVKMLLAEKVVTEFDRFLEAAVRLGHTN